MLSARLLTPCLWFDGQAEEAAQFYTAIFPNSKLGAISRYGEGGQEFHGQPVGSVMAVSFELGGQPFSALNGGPQFTFNEAISFQIMCENQVEVNHYWDALTEGGDESAQQCGWLKDKYGLSWQVVPRVLFEMLDDPDGNKAQRVMAAMMQMKKLDIGVLEQAYQG